MWWRRFVYIHYYRTVKRALHRVFFGLYRRDENRVRAEYGTLWKRKVDELLKAEKARVQFLYNRPLLCSAIDNRRYIIRRLEEHIASFDPRTILELGSGNGINSIALALLNPSRRFYGVELTREGVEAASALLKNPPIRDLVFLTGLSREVVRERFHGLAISFVEGDMRRLPFDDGFFDFAFSWVAFEQLPRDYPLAFREAHRVLKGYAVFFEEFGEAQANIFQRMNLRNLDYFRASFRVVEDAGFSLRGFMPLPLRKVKYTIGEVVASS